MKKTICLNMIVKNEAHIILETLNSVKKYIDYWVISDTGSTDGTQTVIKEFFEKENIKGELYNDKWENFGHNRTKALEHAYDKSDYVWIIDADDLLIGDLILPEEDIDMFHLQFGSSVVYERPQIFKNRELKWIYKGILHEFAFCINKNNIKKGKINNCHIDSRRLGSRSKLENKYKLDAELLADYIEKNPNDELIDRYCFYAAQSYYDADDFVKSIHYYKKRIDLKLWYEEVYYSLYRIGVCLRRLNANETTVKEAFLQAFKYNSKRIEPLFELSEYYILNKQYKKAIFYLEQVVKIPFYTDQLLFVNKYMYNRSKLLLVASLHDDKQYEKAYTFADLFYKECDEYKDFFENNRKSLLGKLTDKTYYSDKTNNLSVSLSNNLSGLNLTFVLITDNYDNFTKTINSFINCCNDLQIINKWIIVNNFNESEINKSKSLYGFCEFTNNQQWYNIITTPYTLIISDKWKFVIKKNFIKKSLEILIKSECSTNKIIQVMYSKPNGIITNIIENSNIKVDENITYSTNKNINRLLFYSEPYIKILNTNMINTNLFNTNLFTNYITAFLNVPCISTKININFDDYIFYPNVDSYGNDIEYLPNLHIQELKTLSDLSDNCICFNTYGYLKNKIEKIIQLPNKNYHCDGLYIKKSHIFEYQRTHLTSL